MIEQITDLQFKRVCMFINEHRDLMKKLFNIKSKFVFPGSDAQ